MRILIIDDNPALLNVLGKLLEIKGFFVTAETTFKSGLRHFEKKSYHVVFIDVPLEHYTEKQILTSLKKHHVFQKTNVLLFSSVDFNNITLDEWKKEGLYSYLKKPVKRSTIIKILDDIRTKISSEHSQISSELLTESEEATDEQLEKLNQLQKQIEELENISHQHAFSQKDSQLEKSTGSVPEPIVNTSNLKNIINNLKSLQSTFESAEQSMEKPSVEADIRQDEIIKKKLEQTLFEFSKLKNEIQLLNEIDDSKLKYSGDSAIKEKKSKKPKKSARDETKKSKKPKKSARDETKKSKKPKKSARAETKKTF